MKKIVVSGSINDVLKWLKEASKWKTLGALIEHKGEVENVSLQ